jgi:Ca2+-transporting ATPase
MAAHIPIAGLALLPLAFGIPLVLFPVHIAFLEMVVDPVCSIAFEAEPEEGDVMSRPPRDPRSPLFSFPLILWSMLQGATVLVATAAIFLIEWMRGMPETEVRSLAFVALVVRNIAMILAGRSFSTSVVRALSKRRNSRIATMLAAGTSYSAVQEATGCSRATVAKVARRLKAA